MASERSKRRDFLACIFNKVIQTNPLKPCAESFGRSLVGLREGRGMESRRQGKKKRYKLIEKASLSPWGGVYLFQASLTGGGGYMCCTSYV